MIVDLTQVLVPARRHHYALGAFNVYNLERLMPSSQQPANSILP
jgi:fructose/tagatose bisphosphate aldolase